MFTIEKSECLPQPRPRSPAFRDTLSSCLRDGTQKSYLSSYFFFFFFFFFLLLFFFFFFFFSKPDAVFFFFVFCFFFVFFFVLNQIYCIQSLHLAWLVQNTLRLTFLFRFICIETTEFTDSQSENHLAYLLISCADKIKKLAKLEEKIRSVRSV